MNGMAWTHESRESRLRVCHRHTLVCVVAALCLAAVLAGCAPTEEWVKPGASDAQRDRDASECLVASVDTVPSAQGPQRRLNQDRYRRCMSDRGYTVRQTGQ